MKSATKCRFTCRVNTWGGNMNDNKNVSLFNFKDHRVRVVDIDGSPWFVAADVCRALGLVGWASTYTLRLDLTEKQVIRKGDVSSLKLETLFGDKQPSLSLITESGLYKLVMKSRKEDAKEFQDWVTRDVLPAIRKDGMYVQGEEKIDLTDDDALDRMTELVLEGIRRKLTRVEKERDEALADRQAVQPKVDLADKVVEVGRTLARSIRTYPGVNSMKIKSDLMRHGYLYQKGGTYRVHSKYRQDVFIERVTEPQGYVDIIVGPKGHLVLDKLYNDNQLTMLKGQSPVDRKVTA